MVISILPPPLHPLPLFLSSYLLRSFYFFFFSSSSRVHIHFSFSLSLPISPRFSRFRLEPLEGPRFNFEGVEFEDEFSDLWSMVPLYPLENRRVVECQRDFCIYSCHSVCARHFSSAWEHRRVARKSCGNYAKVEVQFMGRFLVEAKFYCRDNVRK